MLLFSHMLTSHLFIQCLFKNNGWINGLFKNRLLKNLLLILASIIPSATVWAAPAIEYSLQETRTHKTEIFTQGLEIRDGYFYESSGLYGKSFIATYPIAESGSTWAKVSAPYTQRSPVAARFFAEGLTLVEDKLYLLSWREKTLHIFDRVTFALDKTLAYEGEGWGLTFDGQYLIRSDGSDTLFYHDKDTFTVIKRISITRDGKPQSALNELEYHQGFIWANIWHSHNIVKINPITGEIVGYLDLTKIASEHTLKNSEDVLNGIAWDHERKGFWITGKRWNKMYLLTITDYAASK